MQNTETNYEACMELVAPFVSMRRVPADNKRFEAAVDALAQTLVDACSSLAVAAEIAKTVLREEEDFPAPATLRKRMRDKQYAEQDVMAEEQARTQRDIQRQREVMNA